MEEEEKKEIQEAIEKYPAIAKALTYAIEDINKHRKNQNNILTIILAVTFITELITLVVTLLK